jgi:hypothetical protein
VNESECSRSALSYVTDGSVRELSKVIQALEVVTPSLPLDKGKGREVEAEASVSMPIPEPVPLSEEEDEEEEEIPEVVHSGTPLPVQESGPQVCGQVPSQVGPMRNMSNSPWSVGPYPMDGHRQVRNEHDRDLPIYTCCVVGSAISRGSRDLYQVDYGRCHTVVRSDSTSAACYCGDRHCRGCGDGWGSG